MRCSPFLPPLSNSTRTFARGLPWESFICTRVIVAGLSADCALAPLPFALATGIALNIPFAVLIKLGQDYLPTRPGTAAGVTLGLGVSVGGLAAPLLALIANSHGPRGALMALLVVPPLAIACGLLLRDPGDARRRRPRELGADVRPDATGRGQGA